jgi:hypothetical protein
MAVRPDAHQCVKASSTVVRVLTGRPGCDGGDRHDAQYYRCRIDEAVERLAGEIAGQAVAEEVVQQGQRGRLGPRDVRAEPHAVLVEPVPGRQRFRVDGCRATHT